jgi:hypothetical protein
LITLKFCSGIFIVSCLKGLLFNKLIADSNSRLVLYLLRKIESGNFEKTANNVIDRVISKGLRKIGVSKTASELAPSAISLGGKLTNDN